MPTGDVEVFYNTTDERWRVRIEGGEILDGDYQTKDEAVDAGRDIARDHGAELTVKKQDGTIGERDSHGHDPRDIPG